MDGVSLEAELNRIKAKDNPNAWLSGSKITTAQLLEAIKNKTEIILTNDYPVMKASTTLGFGKYAAKTYEWVKKNDSGYFYWACENVQNFKEKANM